MMLFLLSARYRVTHLWDDSFHWPKTGEIAMSLTGHFEERHVGWDGTGDLLQVVEVKRFRFTYRAPGIAYRVLCRDKGRTSPPREIAWRLPSEKDYFLPRDDAVDRVNVS